MKLKIFIILVFVSSIVSIFAQVAEPDTQVDAINANSDGTTQIRVTWTHNDTGDTVGYLILACLTSGAYKTVPGDVVPSLMTENSNIGDNSENGVYHVKELSYSYTWKGMDPGTTYFFKVFPYNFVSGTGYHYLENCTLEASATTDEPLPITLSSFTVSYNMSLPILNWTTQSEQNNHGWNVYRSTINDLSSSIQINEPFLIPGAGTTTTPTDYTFNDTHEIEINTTYWYWLESVSFSGISEVYGPVHLTIPNSEPGHNNPTTPIQYGLMQNFPNPFNPNTEISFRLKEDSRINLLIFNVEGKKVNTLLKNQFVLKENVVRAVWNGKDQYGRQVASGVYFACLMYGSEITTRRMLMVK